MSRPPDHLRSWLRVRATVPWHTVRDPDPPDSRPVTPIRDGAKHDIHVHDQARDPQRAARLLAAVDRARDDAAADRALTFDRLSAWQCLVLGTARAPFRGHPAFAKRGRERYGTGPGILRRFEDCLAQSSDTAVPLAARAARAYLDVCFFHPFADGNARSAFVAVTFVLARAGIVLDQVGPIRHVQRHADDADAALHLANLVAILMTRTYHRAGSACHRAGRGPSLDN